jgi:hypothetical protein
VKALVLQLQAFVDGGLRLFGRRRLALLLNQPFAVEAMRLALRLQLLLFGGKLVMRDRLLLPGLLLLERFLMLLKLKLVRPLPLLLLQFESLRLIHAQLLIFKRLGARILRLLQQVLLMLSPGNTRLCSALSLPGRRAGAQLLIFKRLGAHILRLLQQVLLMLSPGSIRLCSALSLPRWRADVLIVSRAVLFKLLLVKRFLLGLELLRLFGFESLLVFGVL